MIRYLALCAMVFFLDSCKKTLDFNGVKSLEDEELLSASETDILEPAVLPLEIVNSGSATSSKSMLFPNGALNIQGIPQAGPSQNLLPPPFLPPVPAVPPDAYADDDAIDPFLDSPRIFGIPYSVCGNGTVEPRELCDDGNVFNDDGCNVLCLLPICGNGLLELHEECDDNNLIDGDGCTKCTYDYCGNGRIDKLPCPAPTGTTNTSCPTTGAPVYEECDDGNNKPGDGCSPCCTKEVCKNSIVEPGEECDDTETDCNFCCKIVPVTPPTTL